MAQLCVRLSCSLLLVLAACSTTDGSAGRAAEQSSESSATSGKRPDAGKPKTPRDPGNDDEDNADDEDSAADEGRAKPDDENSTGSSDRDGKSGGGNGLPCDVQAVLAQSCAECHGNPTKFGAPFSLVSRADLLTELPDADGKTHLEAALERVQDDVSPMPPAPSPRLEPGQIATLQAWLDDGAPAESCAAPADGSDAGTMGSAVGNGDQPKPDDCEDTFELRAHGGAGAADKSKFKIAAEPPAQGNQYHCFYFDPPYGDDAGLFWFESIIDNDKNLHHWILYATENKTHADGTTAGCDAAQTGSYFVAGWAPGSNNGVATPDVALDLPSGPRAGLILEVHYYNNTGKEAEDASGIRFCTGKKTDRPHLAAVHQLGTEGICVPPGQMTDAVGMCNPRTDMGDIHLTGVWPHMHKTARHMKVTINRADGSKDVIHDEPFDFNSQIFYPLTDVVLRAGDSVETRCTFHNESTTEVHYGERTQDEMCYAFTPAWPAGALANAPTPFSNPSAEIVNRCGDPLSILSSCNGLADAPGGAGN